MARRKSTKATRPIESYRHANKERVNNPPVGLVTPDTDPDLIEAYRGTGSPSS